MEKRRLGSSVQMNSVIDGRRSRKPKTKSVIPNAGLGCFERLVREAGVGSIISVTAFSGHAVLGSGMGTLGHSKSSAGLWWFIRLQLAGHVPLRLCFS